MNRFAELLDALLFTPSRNGKLRLMREYFATTPDPERGWALAALTGELNFAEAKPSQVRDMVRLAETLGESSHRAGFISISPDWGGWASRDLNYGSWYVMAEGGGHGSAAECERSVRHDTTA